MPRQTSPSLFSLFRSPRSYIAARAARLVKTQTFRCECSFDATRRKVPAAVCEGQTRWLKMRLREREVVFQIESAA